MLKRGRTLLQRRFRRLLKLLGEALERRRQRKAATKKAADLPVVEVGQSPAEIGETLKQAGIEIKDKAKEAGMRPVREFYTSVASQAFSIVHGILDGLDPSKNKKGK